MYIASILLTVVISLLLHNSTEQSTPLPRTTHPLVETDFRAFPTHMYCPEIGVPYIGGSWGGIAIGVSTIDELQDYLETLGGKYFVGYIAESFFFELISSDSSSAPTSIIACIDAETDVVTALNVSVSYQSNLAIEDLIATYGIPDAVTWDEVPEFRVLFWFDRGLAAVVCVDFCEPSTQCRQVMRIVYFPYQPSHLYEERWPYNQTAFSAAQIATPIDEQHPFDFDTMIATLEAEPWRTPTPTVSP